MSKPEFVYTIYIRATLEQVWAGLIEPEFTRQYWMHDNVSDWKVGSKWEHRQANESAKVVIEGTVVESDRPKRLVLTWAPPADQDNPDKVSRVTFELAAQEGWPGGPWTQLKLIHSDLEPDSEMLTSVSWGWPAVASGLKSVIETGGWA